MEVHRFEKLWIAASVVLILAFVGTVTYGALGEGIRMVNDEGGQLDPDDLEDSEFADPRVEQTGENEYAVYVVAYQFAFSPDPIRVPAGSEVTFYLTSRDVVHGFSLVGTNVNMMAIPGQVAQATVEFDEAGEYGIVCHEYCGAAHHEMAGQVVVVPAERYDGNASAAAVGGESP